MSGVAGGAALRPLLVAVLLLSPPILVSAPGAPEASRALDRARGQAVHEVSPETVGPPDAEAGDATGAEAVSDSPAAAVGWALGAAAGEVPATAASEEHLPATGSSDRAPPPGEAHASAVEQDTAGTARSFTVAGSGDLLIHSPVYQAAEVAEGPDAHYDFGPMFEPVAPVVGAADLAICHLEVPLSADNSDVSGYPLFMGPRELAGGIAEAGFDACSTASNHSVDQGSAGVASTLDALDDAGVGHAGTARTKDEAGDPDVYDAGGVTVAHISYTYGLNGLSLPEPWMVNLLDADDVVADAQDARDAGAEFVVASLHWGVEYQREPTSAQRDLAEQLLEDGSVDLILGHHAHVVQPIEHIDGRVVAYGLGNFLSNQSAACCPPETQDGVIVLVDVEEVAPGTFESDARAVPTWVDREGGYDIVDVVAELAGGGLPEERREALEASRERTESALSSGHDDDPATIVGESSE